MKSLGISLAVALLIGDASASKQNVFRIELTKQFVPHHEMTELDLDEGNSEQIVIEDGNY